MFCARLSRWGVPKLVKRIFNGKHLKESMSFVKPDWCGEAPRLSAAVLEVAKDGEKVCSAVFAFCVALFTPLSVRPPSASCMLALSGRISTT